MPEAEIQVELVYKLNWSFIDIVFSSYTLPHAVETPRSLHFCTFTSHSSFAQEGLGFDFWFSHLSSVDH